ncbi:MAG: aldo/keto reductase [Microbacteriaceae bacterium]|nr:MAG: aldo/keto reductase [Microbacteriaceae bacterium]
MTIPALALNNGMTIPQLGLGTWPLDDAQVEATIVAATRLGYRHIDTGVSYHNEVGVGRGMAASGIPRSELFVTTKLDGEFQGEDRAIAGLDACLQRLQLDYVDLVLIHWPLPQRDQYVPTWRTFQTLQASGRTRAIGVSNFAPRHLQRLIDETGVVPAVNQVELSPAIPREDYRAFHRERGIVTISYSPLTAGRNLTADPMIARLGRGHGKSSAQVILRWHVQAGLVAVPKSKSPERLAQNLDVFDFELTAEDLAAIATLSLGPGAGVDPEADGH